MARRAYRNHIARADTRDVPCGPRGLDGGHRFLLTPFYSRFSILAAVKPLPGDLTSDRLDLRP